MNNQKNIPNSGQKTVQAHMKVKSFVTAKSPSQKQLEKHDAELNAFLITVDNRKRFLNGRNSYAIGDRVYTLIWYLERMNEKPVATPFGKKDDKTDSAEGKKVK